MQKERTLPIHPYSYKLMKPAIDEAIMNGSSVYHVSGDIKAPIKIQSSENGIVFSSFTPIAQFMPYDHSDSFERMGHGLDSLNRNECHMSEFFFHELLQQSFSVKNKETGAESQAIISTSLSRKEPTFVVIDEEKVVSSIAEFEKRYTVTPGEPTLSPLRTEKSDVDFEEQFWKIVDKLNWKSDFDSERCEKEILASFDPETISLIHSEFQKKKSELYRFSRDIDFSGHIVTESSLIAFAESAVSCGKAVYESAKGSELSFKKYMNKINHEFGISVPFVVQDHVYPYTITVDSMSDPFRRQGPKAAAIECMHLLNKIDYDHVTPARRRDIEPVVAEAISRLEKIISGDHAGAYKDFDVAAYNRLSKFSEAGLHAQIANLLSNVMMKDGLDYTTTKWKDGSPVVMKNKPEKKESELDM
ncbi:hypothetical protein [Aeromonas veronii]|uniref:Uncharacterized protein n=1 Tax=Aeromonas veronii TaxID=654 RepID=A0A2T4MZF0_AERVE|nr:hypothetical protein [Aeromonas veronii]PTH79970.1 hypothetical protein DAA48_17045 [Aeromonas veronii]